MKTKSFNRVIGWVLIFGWAAFVLLLAGVASGLLTK
jgi:hypothetical protein